MRKKDDATFKCIFCRLWWLCVFVCLMCFEVWTTHPSGIRNRFTITFMIYLRQHVRQLQRMKWSRVEPASKQAEKRIIFILAFFFSLFGRLRKLCVDILTDSIGTNRQEIFGWMLMLQKPKYKQLHSGNFFVNKLNSSISVIYYSVGNGYFEYSHKSYASHKTVMVRTKFN